MLSGLGALTLNSDAPTRIAIAPTRIATAPTRIAIAPTRIEIAPRESLVPPGRLVEWRRLEDSFGGMNCSAVHLECLERDQFLAFERLSDQRAAAECEAEQDGAHLLVNGDDPLLHIGQGRNPLVPHVDAAGRLERAARPGHPDPVLEPV